MDLSNEPPVQPNLSKIQASHIKFGIEMSIEIRKLNGAQGNIKSSDLRRPERR